MKKARITALCLAVSLLILSFAGCGKAPERTEVPEPIGGPKLADLKATDSLVIYTYTGSGVATLDQRRINQFSVLYDVDVEIVRVDGDYPDHQ